MRKILLLFVLYGCSSKEKIEPPPSPNVVDEKAEWIKYEGIIKTEYGESQVVLSLMQNEVGLESDFRLEGYIRDDQDLNWIMGRYTILHGAAGQEIIIQAHGMMSFLSDSDRKQINENLKKFKEKDTVIHYTKPYHYKPEIVELDLFFKSDGINKLELVDKDFNPITEDSRYTLYKRDRLFTIEGYITFEKNRTDFIEKNTLEKWNVASLGVYNDARKSYDSIATENFEGVYLKAVAYSVASDSSDEDLLVIKRIIQIKKSDAYTDKKRAAGLGY